MGLQNRHDSGGRNVVMSGMNRELIAQVTRTGAIRRLLQLAEYGYWAPPSDSMLNTEDERALIGAELVERHPSPWSGQMRATTTGARLASKIVLLVRDEMERQVYAPESNDLNVGYQPRVSVPERFTTSFTVARSHYCSEPGPDAPEPEVTVALGSRWYGKRVTLEVREADACDLERPEGMTRLVPTANVGMANTGDVEECCIVCGEPTDGGHEPSCCVENIEAGSKQAHDFLVEETGRLERENSTTWQLIFDLLRAHDRYELTPVKDHTELTEATNAIRDAAKARGYVAPVPEFHIFTDTTDWIIGMNLQEAKAAYAEQVGLDPDELSRDEDWEQLDDSKVLTIKDYDGNGNSKTQTCAEWVKEHVRSRRFDRLVCSRNH